MNSPSDSARGRFSSRQMSPLGEHSLNLWERVSRGSRKLQGTCTAPALDIPASAMMNWMEVGRSVATRSPFSTPMAARALASRLAWSLTSG